MRGNPGAGSGRAEALPLVGYGLVAVIFGILAIGAAVVPTVTPDS